MSKILGSWSGMRKYLEKEMLADCLRGRVRYSCTTYVGMDGCRVFELYIDNHLVKRFSWETVNTYFLQNGCKPNNHPYGTSEYWEGFWEALRSFPMQTRTEYTDEEFCEALAMYRNQSIDASINSDNPLEIMLAIMDRRCGKRKLAAFSDTFSGQPAWLEQILKIRLDAEQLRSTTHE